VLHAALDGREASHPVHGTGTGVGRYVYNLLAALPAAAGDLRYTVFGEPGQVTPAAVGQMAWVRLPPYPGSAHWALPLLARRLAAQVLHGTANTLPLLRASMPAVVTLHDLAIYRHPEFFPGRQAFSTRVLIPRTLRRAARVICPSAYTAQDAQSLFGVPPERLRIIPHGVEEFFRRPPAPAALQAARDRYRLPARYVLFVGTLQPRKNLEMALKAVAAARRQANVSLVVAGGRGWRDEAALELIRTLKLEDGVRLLGYVPVSDLPALYRQAEVFLFPSRYEGFGLPVLEAMACGAPVIASSETSLPEVAGDAALLVPPSDEAGWVRALEQVLHDPATRARLVTGGAARARQYSWARSAAAHVAVYREAAGV
jgi:glycosyltransferase involved in cell wall biosynthesis